MGLVNYIKKSLRVSVIATGLVGISLTGCNQRMETSEPLFERAKVVRMEHKKAHSDLKYGIKYDGKFGLKTVNYPEENIIEFDGEVDFKVNNKKIYNKFNEGDSARVSYNKNYIVTLEDLDKDGKKEETKRELRGCNFLGADKK